MKETKSQARTQQVRTTLREVAHRAGVSASTASLVLNGKSQARGILAGTEERVRNAALELNYAPNLLLRSLRRGQTRVLSFYNAFRNRKAHDLYMDSLSSGVEYAGGVYGYDILVHCTFDRSAWETYQTLNGGLTDGVLMFAPEPDEPLLQYLRKSDLPVVLLNSQDPEGRFPSVCDDIAGGMRLIANALLENGHRRIACFNALSSSSSKERVALLRRYLGEAGVTIPEAWIIEFYNDRKGTLAALMAESEPPTAIFCWHDRMAYWTLEICEELGISVPRDLSIIGYDGLHWPATTGHIATSILVDLERLADEGVRVLDLYNQGYEGPLIEATLPVTFLPGSTLAPPYNSPPR